MEMAGGNSTTLSTLCDVNNYTDPAYKYPPSDLSVAFCVITCGLGLPLNLYVAWLIIRREGSSIESDMFFLNLALTDIVFLTGYLMTPFVRFCPVPLFRATGYFFALIVVGHPLFQICVCVERYLAVLHPVLFQRYRPLRYRVAASAVVWLVVLSSFTLSKLKSSYYEIAWPALSFVWFPCMIFCCLSVLRALRKPGPGDGMGERAGANQVKVKAFHIITVIMMTQFITLIAFIVSLCAKYLNNSVKEIIFEFVYIIVLSAFNVQPVLFLQRARKLPSIAIC